MPELTLADIPAQSAAAWVVDSRLSFHSQEGKSLAGLKYSNEGTFKVDGKDDLPRLQCYSVSIGETLSAGAPTTNQYRDRANQPVAGVVTLIYRLSVDKRYGFFQRQSGTGKGVIDWASLIQDAIETREDGTPDARLEGTLIKPVSFAIREDEPNGFAFHVYVEVSLPTMHLCRMARGIPR